ncbi:TetR/AcrR family transcriptional regulator [Sinosporangium siamense]|uniref:TetR family transcriptional regulator n=1 Tax=Sinosporangium siamense TaxID=1367973 RepID=A0A919RPL4_9ACTN|nr:TetR/AcrR family transcriptional regulator [Sinosporangium siamense]GII96680.1 TetR family transcriptional regulator [Sinosporangium siamense]
MTGDPAVRRRRRGAALERAILYAAVQELTESGYAGLTMDKVARRAGTNKNAIYRRWPNRTALGVAAYRELVSADPQLPDTGDLRSDALELLRRANRHWASPYGEILRDLMSSSGGAPELLAQLHDHPGDEDAVWLTVLGRAVARGEVHPEALHPRVATVAVALLRNEYSVRGTPSTPDSVIVEIVDEVYLPLVRHRGVFTGA